MDIVRFLPVNQLEISSFSIWAVITAQNAKAASSGIGDEKK
jgi:hypothetical protein